jgi:hypothetical protein
MKLKRKVIAFFVMLFNDGVNNAKTQYFTISDNAKLSRQERKLNKVIKEAIKRANATGRTHYVLKDWNGNPYAANKRELIILQKNGLFKRKVNIFDILNDALYIASGKFGPLKNK